MIECKPLLAMSCAGALHLRGVVVLSLWKLRHTLERARENSGWFNGYLEVRACLLLTSVMSWGTSSPSYLANHIILGAQIPPSSQHFPGYCVGGLLWGRCNIEPGSMRAVLFPREKYQLLPVE